MTESPDDKPLRTPSFIIHATRGVIRDQTARRKMMFVLLVIALVLLFLGSTFLANMLNPREHLLLSILFWAVCLWLTLTAMLLALFDLLIVRAQSRKAQKLLHGEVAETQSPDSPGKVQ